MNKNISKEMLYHFQCDDCKKWWTIGDAPEDKCDWFCPWCGHEQVVNLDEAENKR